MGTFLLTVLMLVGLFLMFVILLQRGRGGGLAGAFGGLGGQSAFGTKAGDVFTVITIVTVCLWVVVACLAGWRLRVEDHDFAMQDRPDAVDDKGDTGADAKKANTRSGDGDEAAPDKKNPAEKDEKPAEGAEPDDKQPPAGGAASKPDAKSDTKPDAESTAPDDSKKPSESDKSEADKSPKSE